MECVLKAVKKFLEEKEKEIKEIQSVIYEEQKKMAELQLFHARIMCKACKLEKKCEVEEIDAFPSEDTFFFLKQFLDEGLISEEYAQLLHQNLIKIKKGKEVP